MPADGSMFSEYVMKFIGPRFLEAFEGCNKDPYDLSKHLSAAYFSALSSSLIGRSLSFEETERLERIVYETMGYPSCWRDETPTDSYIQ